MQYGHFDNENREYVIDRVDLPTSWTNYIGVKDMCAVLNHTAGGYIFYKSPEYHRITRFRPNGVPMDRPGHYVYLRDDESGDYWSVSWQPVGKPLDQAKYTCRHGMSYSVYECDYSDIFASQKMSVAMDDPVEIWDVRIKNNSDRTRKLSVFSYLEFSFHQIAMDNQNFQMSMYASGSSYEDGIIECDLFYEEFGYQFFTADFTPDSYDCLRDKFIGSYRTEDNPIGVENGHLSGSSELGNNHCGALHKQLVLKPGEEVRVIFLLGEGTRENGKKIRAKYANGPAADHVYEQLKVCWDKKINRLQIHTPDEGMNTLINTWTLYQAEVNIMFSRFASFIEVGGRTGLGYRDTSQDSMTVPHSNPEKCRQRIVELLRGLVKEGYGLHLFQPEWFDPEEKGKKPFKSPTVVPTPKLDDMIHGIEDTCSDDALWLVASINEYIKETGEFSFLDEIYTYADGGEGSVYEHMKRILDFSCRQVGEDGICKGLRADWNDCLNLGGGESAMVSFLHYWAITKFVELAKYKGEEADVKKYTDMGEKVKAVCNQVLWDGDWYIRGITANGRKIGTKNDTEGKIHLESNAWAVLSGAAPYEKGIKAMDSIYEQLFTPYGIMLNGPAYTKPDDDIGFVTRVYPGLKENASIFSHPNPWAWAAECMLGRGDRAMEFYHALCPYYQNDKIEIREAEPYSYCQFVVGKDHTAFGRARHPFMTGTGGWAYYSATHYMLGIRPGMDALEIDPCIPKGWDGFTLTRQWRGAQYDITVENPEHVSKGVCQIFLDGALTEKIPVQEAGSTHKVRIVMGSTQDEKEEAK
ncbi:MAG TPA: N,N'-diacetylchitobiose phosphorylase [Blautia sp.]|nr:N,N'-diacetylchitobiose phosphorylase [Blautia sp.]